MSGNTGPRDPQKARRSTRMGIALLIVLAIAVIAIVWGIQRWSDDEIDGPSVSNPAPITTITATYNAQVTLAA